MTARGSTARRFCAFCSLKLHRESSMIRTLALVFMTALTLAACQPPVEPTPVPTEPPMTATTPPVAGDVLTAQGFGPLRIGMTRPEVEAALGKDADPNSVGGPDPDSCDMFRPARAPEGMLVMVEDGVLTSIWLISNAGVVTDRGIGVGAAPADVKKAYGTALTAQPHKYQDAPAEYLLVWTSADHDSPAARGLKYEVSVDGQVTSIAAGGPSIGYVEGCS
jgi:hypothetical protein